MDMLLQQVINGLSIGCIYALIALGYTMVYGVLRMVNFAHGELFMAGPLFALYLLRIAGIVSGPFSLAVGTLTGLRLVGGLLLGLLGAALFSGVLGVALERFAFRPLRNASSAITVLSSMGASIFLQNAAMLLGGRNKKAFPRLITTKYYTIGGAILSNVHVLIAISTVVVVVLLFYVVKRTSLGRCIRATSENKDVARLMGVDVNQTIALVFFVGAGIGAISGWLYAVYYEQAIYSMGSIVGIKGFTAAVVGGIGEIGGSALGGISLGVLETVLGGYLPIITRGALGTEYKDVFTFIVLVIVLILRPQGFFGRTTESRY
jgi:branched-chain amino acid transport system permease protein